MTALDYELLGEVARVTSENATADPSRYVTAGVAGTATRLVSSIGSMHCPSWSVPTSLGTT